MAEEPPDLPLQLAHRAQTTSPTGRCYGRPVEIEVSAGTQEDVDALAPLWAEMLEHHRAIGGERWPVRQGEDAWSRRRQQYRTWLSERSALLFVARVAGSPQPVGYLVCLLIAAGPTFDLGSTYGDVDPLSVTAEARGEGVGSRLLQACRAALRERGISYWSIGIVAGNDGAQRLYERLGFAPWTEMMLAPIR
jgi:ribosomal protein S18 acetylase RimI-like enzyme